MEHILDEVEIRVLGSLIEKEMVTPEYYPLSLNALVNACNQKSNRDPVVTYDETTIVGAINGLREKRLVTRSDSSRVPKYEENFIRKNNLINREAAIICILLLRGAQTLGETRSRTDSLYKFRDIEEVEKTLDDLSERGFLIKLPRQPGHKESRFAHLFAGEPKILEVHQAKPESSALIVKADNDRITHLEQEITFLRQEFGALKEEFLSFKQQFE
jgi:uncharacterized protein